MHLRGSGFALLALLALGCARDEKKSTRVPEDRSAAPSMTASNVGPVVWLTLDRRRMATLGVEYRDVEAALGREPRVSFSPERADADMYELRLSHLPPDEALDALLKRTIDGKTDLQLQLKDIATVEVRSK